MYYRLKELRDEKELNQKQMGEILGMSQTGYSKYETGENDIPTPILLKLSAFHNASIDYILNATDVKQPYPRNKYLKNT